MLDNKMAGMQDANHKIMADIKKVNKEKQELATMYVLMQE